MELVPIFAVLAMLLLAINCLKKSPTQSEPDAESHLLRAMRDRNVYFERLSEGSGQGFLILLMTDPYTHDTKQEAFNRAVDRFLRRYLEFDPTRNVFPEAHVAGIEYTFGGLVLIVGHPLNQAEDYQSTLVRRYVKGWFRSLDEESSGLRGLASIAKGEIQFRKPDAIHQGGCRGPVFIQGIQTMADAVHIHKTWPQNPEGHRIAANKSAVEALALSVSTEDHRNQDDPELVLYGYDWDPTLFH